MSTPPPAYCSVDDYLALEATSDIKHEYVDAAIYAMTGASYTHNVLVSNSIGLLHNQLRGRRCNVLPSAMRVHVSAHTSFFYPDISVVCGAPLFFQQRSDTITNPIVIFEVLSPSTADYDRGLKFELYRTLPALQAYITIAQDRMHVMYATRQPAERWMLIDLLRPEQQLDLTAINCRLTLAEIYESAPLAGRLPEE